MNALERIPAKARLALYLGYTVAGPVVAYCAAKGYVGDAEVVLYASLGTALGLTAAANVTRPRTRVPVEDVPHEAVVAEPADVVIVVDKALKPEDYQARGYGSGV